MKPQVKRTKVENQSFPHHLFNLVLIPLTFFVSVSLPLSLSLFLSSSFLNLRFNKPLSLRTKKLCYTFPKNEKTKIIQIYVNPLPNIFSHLFSILLLIIPHPIPSLLEFSLLSLEKRIKTPLFK